VIFYVKGKGGHTIIIQRNSLNERKSGDVGHTDYTDNTDIGIGIGVGFNNFLEKLKKIW
jgi:hypothetical protein